MNDPVVKDGRVVTSWWCNDHKCWVSWSEHLFCDTTNLKPLPKSVLKKIAKPQVCYYGNHQRCIEINGLGGRCACPCHKITWEKRHDMSNEELLAYAKARHWEDNHV